MSKPKMWLLAASVLAIGGASPSASLAQIDDVEVLAHRLCPGRHLERLTAGHWQEIILDGKGPIFSASVEHRLIGPERHFSRVLNCAKLATLDCDVAARLSAIQSMGLLKTAARQICRDWRCEDEATCTYSARSSQPRP